MRVKDFEMEVVSAKEIMDNLVENGFIQWVHGPLVVVDREGNTTMHGEAHVTRIYFDEEKRKRDEEAANFED